jgi:hypothetical protein
MKQKNQIKKLLKYVILAPSGYNTQPWKFKLDDNSLEIIPDYTRTRISTDPEYREFFMSLGTAAFNLEVAAKHFGMAYQKSYRIDEKAEKYSIFFEFDGQKTNQSKSPLFAAIPTRHTNRFPYLDEKLSKTLVSELRSLPRPDSVEFNLITRPGDITSFSKLINNSFQLWSRQQSLVEELENWLRDDLEFSPDGLPTGVINLYKLAINFKYFLHPSDPQAKTLSLKSQNLAKKAPALAVISTKKDTVADWFQAGEFFELVALTLASHKIATDFFNYPLILKKTRQETATLINNSSIQPQLLFRLGKPTVAPPRTSRYPLSQLLTS